MLATPGYSFSFIVNMAFHKHLPDIQQNFAILPKQRIISSTFLHWNVDQLVGDSAVRSTDWLTENSSIITYTVTFVLLFNVFLFDRLIPTARYYPLRFLCIRMLNLISLKTGIYTPSFTHVLEVRNSLLFCIFTVQKNFWLVHQIEKWFWFLTEQWSLEVRPFIELKTYNPWFYFVAVSSQHCCVPFFSFFVLCIFYREKNIALVLFHFLGSRDHRLSEEDFKTKHQAHRFHLCTKAI